MFHWKLFFIAYDLMSHDDSNIADKLGAMGAKRVLKSVWALKGDYTSEDLRNTLKTYLGANSGLLVVEEQDWSAVRTLININDL